MQTKDYETKMLDSDYEDKQVEVKTEYDKIRYRSPRGNVYTVDKKAEEQFENLHNVTDAWEKTWI